MSQLFRKLKQQYKSNVIQRRTQELAQQLTKVLPQYEGEIPVLVVCYNNGVYVRNTVWQLEQYGIKPIILDNNSTDTITKLILEELTLLEKANVLYSTYNLGHLVGFFEPIYAQLPPVFAYTDPDLQFNTALPENFLEVLQSLTEEFQVFKAGFALDLLEGEEIITHTQCWRKNKNLCHTKNALV
jgi:hypothetical protein